MNNLKDLLESRYQMYNNKEFIPSDPISIPHRFNQKRDIEIAGFLTALISWGNRKAILKSASDMMALLEDEPYKFITEASEKEFKSLERFVYRTFQGDDLLFFIYALRDVYLNYGGLEEVVTNSYRTEGSVIAAIAGLRDVLLHTSHLHRSEKHLANPKKGSAAKRINMFLRWMVRNDNMGVDFGIWNEIPTSALLCPLDVHSGNVARKIGLLKRKQNDLKAVEELTQRLREYDENDPVKYDFALFGLGVFEGWGK